MKSRYKELLKITRDIRSYGDYIRRVDIGLFAMDCDFISVELFCFLKRKMLQNAYLNGVSELSDIIKLYFSSNDIGSFNHYVIKDKKEV
jgi:hypothetical protein|nr:MAG TPA: hypothetical protein [Caudoviricetes sp.]